MNIYNETAERGPCGCHLGPTYCAVEMARRGGHPGRNLNWLSRVQRKWVDVWQRCEREADEKFAQLLAPIMAASPLPMSMVSAELYQEGAGPAETVWVVQVSKSQKDQSLTSLPNRRSKPPPPLFTDGFGKDSKEPMIPGPPEPLGPPRSFAPVVPKKAPVLLQELPFQNPPGRPGVPKKSLILQAAELRKPPMPPGPPGLPVKKPQPSPPKKEPPRSLCLIGCPGREVSR